jgi:hypothetical protein
VDRPPEIPDAPSAPQRPWGILLAAGAVGGAALLLLLWLAKDDATDVPPGWLFAASGIIVAGVGGFAVWLAALQSRLVPRSAVALGGGFACIAVAKFALAPFGFFRTVSGREIQTLGDQGSLIWVTAFGVLVLYLIAIRLIARVARNRLDDAPRARPVVTVGLVLSLAAIGLALPFLAAVATGLGPLFYLDIVFTSVTGVGTTVVLLAAAALVSRAFVTSEDRAQILARASILTTITWLAIAFVILFQALWVVFMLTIVGVWPLRTVTPK